MKLSVIIVNWNVRPLLERCLRSILKNTPSFSYEVIVVDNNSEDDSKEFLTRFVEKRKNFKVIFNRENLGFAKANNLGLKKAKGEYILFLNPDTEILSGALEKAVKIMDKNKKVGAFTGQLVGIDNKPQTNIRPFPSFFFIFSLFFSFQKIFSFCPYYKYYLGKKFDYSKSSFCQQIAGAFLMVRRKILDEIGSFDENFHIWFEDVDLCYRIKKHGWKNYYSPEVKVLHYGGESFKQLMPFCKRKLFAQSALYYVKKHFSKKEYFILRIAYPFSLFFSFLLDILVLFSSSKTRMESWVIYIFFLLFLFFRNFLILAI